MNSSKFCRIINVTAISFSCFVFQAKDIFGYEYIDLPNKTTQIGIYLNSTGLDMQSAECKEFAANFARETAISQLTAFFPQCFTSRKLYSGEITYDHLNFSKAFVFKVFDGDEANPRYSNLFFHDFQITIAKNGRLACIVRDNGTAPNASFQSIDSPMMQDTKIFGDKKISEILGELLNTYDPGTKMWILGQIQDSTWLGHTPESESYYELSAAAQDFSTVYTVKYEKFPSFSQLRSLKIILNHTEDLSCLSEVQN